MRMPYAYIIIITLLLSSCHGKRLMTKNFKSIDNFSELNGRYVNEDHKLSSMFNIHQHNNEVDIVDLNFKTDDSLIISYFDTVGCKTIGLKGKGKENFFEIYFQNTRFYLLPLVVLNRMTNCA